MNQSLIASIWPRSSVQASAKALMVALGVLLLAASARVQVPFWPVPMTLQTLAVLLISVSYGLRLGTTTLLSYLAAGAIGLPVFASGAGIAYLAGPTGGYLAGFVAAAALTGWLADKGHGRSLSAALTMLLAGEVVIFAFGTGWLALLIGVAKAFHAGLLPFVPGEILKTALAAVLLSQAWKRVNS